jgi:hypothetical protein
MKRGQITYDDQHGHVCTCTKRAVGERDVYRPTVTVDRSIEPTESGSWWYSCSRCGAGGWSGL